MTKKQTNITLRMLKRTYFSQCNRAMLIDIITAAKVF